MLSVKSLGALSPVNYNYIRSRNTHQSISYLFRTKEMPLIIIIIIMLQKKCPERPISFELETLRDDIRFTRGNNNKYTLKDLQYLKTK